MNTNVNTSNRTDSVQHLQHIYPPDFTGKTGNDIRLFPHFVNLIKNIDDIESQTFTDQLFISS